MAILGPYARGGPSYTYARGPDGTPYAVGGSVDVDVRPVPGDPEATIRKARMIRAAALGPGQPSAADMRVAAEAYRVEMQAKKELNRLEAEQGTPTVRRPAEAEAPRHTGPVQAETVFPYGEEQGRFVNILV